MFRDKDPLNENTPEAQDLLAAINNSEHAVFHFIQTGEAQDVHSALIAQASTTEQFVRAKLTETKDADEVIEDVFSFIITKNFESIQRIALGGNLPLADLAADGEANPEEIQEWLQDLALAASENPHVDITLTLSGHALGIHQQNIHGLAIYANQLHDIGLHELPLSEASEGMELAATSLKVALEDYLKGAIDQHELRFYHTMFTTACRLFIQEYLSEEDVCDPAVIYNALLLPSGGHNLSFDTTARRYALPIDGAMFNKHIQAKAFANLIVSEGYLDAEQDIIEEVCLWFKDTSEEDLELFFAAHEQTFFINQLKGVSKELLLFAGASSKAIIKNKIASLKNRFQ